jgi:hypothetical protein
MSEFASALATTDGPLHLYAAPGINSNGNARAGWGIKGGAEVEWTGENHDSLTVRYADPAMAKTIKAMLIERFVNRTAMLATIFETRGEGGLVMWYRNGEAWIPEDMKTIHGNLDLRGYAHALPAGLTTTGKLYLDGYEFPLPDALKDRETRREFMKPKAPAKKTKKSRGKKSS